MSRDIGAVIPHMREERHSVVPANILEQFRVRGQISVKLRAKESDGGLGRERPVAARGDSRGKIPIPGPDFSAKSGWPIFMTHNR